MRTFKLITKYNTTRFVLIPLIYTDLDDAYFAKKYPRIYRALIRAGESLN